ncbi:MAG: hypothetical protein IJJ32_00870 [Eggerthellaceae bacterium]|nr:hypothetical protein [Eggerthellaceae bacterium]
MNTETALFLNELNQRFYDACASSFSDTRSAAWPGWRTCLDTADAMRTDGDIIRILDVACGNMRFESFLSDEMGDYPFAVCAIDACESLARTGSEAFGLSVRFAGEVDQPLLAGSLALGEMMFCTCDVVSRLLAGAPMGFSGFDIAACFGFLHHVPGRKARADLLNRLCDVVRPGGEVAVSLWRFMEDERLARKAAETTELARIDLADAFDFDMLEQGDAFLGWQERSGVYRYAHSFSDEDVEALIEEISPRAELVARFRSDGRSGALNEYLVLRKL